LEREKGIVHQGGAGAEKGETDPGGSPNKNQFGGRKERYKATWG